MDNCTGGVKVLNIMTGGLRREGITTTQLEFMRNMDLSDLHVDILAVHNNAQDVIEEFEDIGCRVFIAPDRKKHTIKYLLFLNRLIKKEKYNVIHVHGSSGMLALELWTAKRRKVPVRIAHSHNTRSDNARLDKLFRKIFYKTYTHAFACGQDAGKWLFGDRPFTIIHNGNDFNKFAFNMQLRKKIRSRYNLDGHTAVGFVGNFNNQKNIPFLLEVFAKVVNINNKYVLFLIGDGLLKEQLKQKVSELGIEDNVVFTGRVSNVYEYLQGMDIMCLPSLFEGLPNVVLEWQIAGLPCYVSDKVTHECKATGLVEFLPIDNGIEIWAEKILSADTTQDRSAASERACQQMREAHFDIKENAQFVKSIYMKAVE